MLKKTALLLLACTMCAEASSVTLSSAGTGPSVVALNNTLVPNGSLIRVGMLTTPGDYTTFVEFGTSTVKNAGAGTSAKASKVAGAVANNGASPTTLEDDDTQFNGKAVYIWIYNSATASATADQGLFKSTGFNFPVNDTTGVGDAVTPTAVTFTESVNLPFLTTQAAYVAGVDNMTGSATGGRFNLGGIVPEPSTAMFAAISMLGLVVRRRK